PQFFERIIDFGNGSASNNIVLNRQEESNTLQLYVFNGSAAYGIDAVDAIENGKWMHIIAMVDSSGKGYIYKDGVLLVAGQMNIPTNINRFNNFIGKSNGTNGNKYFNGRMNDFRFYNRALSKTEIDSIFAGTSQANEPNLYLHYKFDEASGTTITDSSGGGRNGTLGGTSSKELFYYDELPVTLSLGSGNDESNFYLNEGSGALIFNTLPDYESGPKSYVVNIIASVGGLSTSKDYTINILQASGIDTDEDGIPDSLDPDDDNDGLVDADEVFFYGTDPLVADTDGDGIQDGAEVSKGTNPTNFAPVIDQGTLVSTSMTQGGSFTAPTLTATDNDGDTLTWSLVNNPANGNAVVSESGSSPGTFTYTPNTNWNGTEYFTVQVSDGKDIDKITVKVTVKASSGGGSSSDFIPYTVGGAAVYDHEGSSDPSNGGASVQPDSIDIASCSPDGARPGNQPSVWIAYRDEDGNYATTDDAKLVFRMRLDADPSERSNQGAGLVSSHWGFLIDINNDGSNDYIVDVDGGYASNRLDKVFLYADRNSDFLIDPDNEKIAEFDAAGSNARDAQKASSVVTITPDTSVLCGRSHDVFLDVAIPVDQFNEEGLVYNAYVPIGMFYSSSASNTDPLQKDWMGSRDGRSDSFIGEGGGVIKPSPGTINCMVYDDVNGDESYASPDTELSQEVELLDLNGNIIYSGGCPITNIDPGNYVIRNITDGYYSTTSKSINVSGGATTEAPLPVYAFKTVTIHVYEDLDGDGSFDEGEPSLNGSSVLFDGTNAGTITSNGSITLDVYDTGQHIIKHESWAAGYIPSSNIEIAINHVIGATNIVHFGLVRAGEISGIVFVDKDGDTSKDSGEGTLAGASITVENEAGDVVAGPSVTGDDGLFRFTGLSPNTKYYVKEVNPSGYGSTSNDEVSVSFGSGSSSVVNFGDVEQGQISGFVFSDDNRNGRVDSGEQGLANVMVTIYFNESTSKIFSFNGQTKLYNPGDSITALNTDRDGYFRLNLPEGRYRVDERDPQGYISISPNSQTVVLPSTQTVVNFADARIGDITGLVFNDLNGNGLYDNNEPGVNGVSLNLDGNSNQASSQSDGKFFFNGQPNGTYTLNMTVPSGFVATTATSQSITVDGQTSNSGQLFGIKISGTIVGEVYHDLNYNGQRDSGEPGLGGAVINIAGTSNATTSSTVSGNFSVSGQTSNGSYTVTETDPANYKSTTNNTVTVNINSLGASDKSADFGDIFEGDVVGIVFSDVNGNGVQDNNEGVIIGATVNLTGKPSVVTDNNGKFKFSRVSGDGLSLSVTRPTGYTDTTSNPQTINMSSYSGSSNFGLQEPGSVLAYVFEDLNKNGIKDSEEGPFSGVQITLSSGENVTTGSDGYARIGDVAVGNNSVSVDALTGYVNTSNAIQAIVVSAGQTTVVRFGKFKNVAPWVRNDEITIAEDTSLNTEVISTPAGDNNGDSLIYSIIEGNEDDKFRMDPVTGKIYLKNPVNYEVKRIYQLTVKVTDPDGLTDTAEITINISDVNEVPIAYDQNISTQEDVSKALTLSATDPEGDNLTYTIVSNPSKGILTGIAPNLTFIPSSNENGSDSFTFKVNDGTLDSNIATVTIGIDPIEDAPIAVNDAASLDEDGNIDIEILANDTDSENNINKASIIVLSGPSHGSISIDPSTGIVTYTPDPNYNGTDIFQYKIKDSTGLTSNVANVVISINPINDPPVAVNDTITTTEDTAIVPLNLISNDSDPDNDVLEKTSVVIVTAPSHASSYSVTDGKLSYSPSANFSGSDVLVYTVKDIKGAVSNQAKVFITITGVNDRPVANDDTATTDEDTAVDINVVSNDTDIEDGTVDEMTVTIVDQPYHGSLSINPTTGVVTYTPNPQYHGNDSFTYMVKDKGLAPNENPIYSNTAKVVITVEDINDIPMANNDSITMNEDEGPLDINILGNDNDPDGTLRPSTVNIVSNPFNGSISINPQTGRASYTPELNFHGTVTFTYTVEDDDGAVSNIAIVTIVINSVNDAPIADAQNVTTDEDTPKAITLTGSDVENDPLTYTIVIQPTNGSLSGTAPNLTYTPTAQYFGSDSFKFKVNDGTNDSNIAEVKITINPVNDAPVANDDSASLDEDSSVTIDILNNDTDPENSINKSSVVIVTPPSHGTLTLDPNTGAIIYTPDPHYNGPDTFQYKFSDNSGASSNVADVSINVNSVNDAPIANNDVITTPEDNPITPFNILANDSDIDNSLDNTSVVIVTAPQHASSYSIVNGVLNYTPAQDYVGGDEIHYTVKDVSGAVSNVAIVYLNITGINDAPVANDDTGTTNEDTAVTVDVVANDTDTENTTVDATTVNIAEPPVHGSVTVNPITGHVTYTPDPDFNGVDSFKYFVKDSGIIIPPAIRSNNATVTITVNPVNDPPVARDDNVTMLEDDPALAINILNNDTDKDGTLDPNSITIISNVSQGSTTIDKVNGRVLYTPPPNFNGIVSFTYKISDNNGAQSNTATVYISINEQNDPPVADDQTIATNEDEAVDITLTASDIEDDELTFTIDTQPTHGSLSGLAPNVTYTPHADYNGVDSFKFVVNDGQNQSNIATVTINVAPVNDPPDALPESIVADKDTPVDLNLQGEDIDKDPLTFTIVTPPSSQKGTLTCDGPVCVFTPAPGFLGPVTFTFKVNDGNEDSEEATLTIDVREYNAPPNAVSDKTFVAVNTSRALTILDNDSDPEKTALQVLSATNPSHGTVTVNTDGTITYTPDQDFKGQDSFSYTISDTPSGYSLPLTASTLVTVNVVDPPQVTPPPDVLRDANALFTKIDLGNATAVDFQGNPLPTSLVDGITFFRPGVNEALWQATDQYGLTGYAKQKVRVRPLVSFSRDQTVVERTQLQNQDFTVKDQTVVIVKMVLNGPSPVYPLTIPFWVSGSSTYQQDHNLTNGNVTFTEYTDSNGLKVQEIEKEIRFNVYIDNDTSEKDEKITLTLYDPATQQNTNNTNMGPFNIHKTTIFEKDINIAPIVNLSSEQVNSSNQRNKTYTVYQNDGNVEITASVTDRNENDNHSFHWVLKDKKGNILKECTHEYPPSYTDPACGTNNNIFDFDPSTITQDPGVYEVKLIVTDTGAPAEMTTEKGNIKVLNTQITIAPELGNDGNPKDDSEQSDSDGDGIPDYQEGYGDADGDGIPDYLDSVKECNVLVENPKENGFRIEADPAVCIRV
ncbi:MAG: Ig-like domain-containing protein, partial [Bdellovibrionales bacterium]|nr:Ig-like domain-containing protein [Bdellovibrionales bacterium]